MAVQRWTDEMLDELASSVAQLQQALEAQRESLEAQRDSIDGLRITAQALLQVAAQHEQEMALIRQRQAESDERFNTLLAEVRYLIRRDERRED